MSADEPTLGEAMRLLTAVSLRLDRLAESLSATYVTREVYEARHGGLTRRIENLEKDAEEKEKSDEASRRQLQFMILGAVLAAGLSLIVALVLASGGISS